MATKVNLLDILGKTLANEDEFIVSYGEDFLKAIRSAGQLNDDDKREINDMLSIMLEDTKRHGRTVKLLQDKIKGDSRNEF